MEYLPNLGRLQLYTKFYQTPRLRSTNQSVAQLEVRKQRMAPAVSLLQGGPFDTLYCEILGGRFCAMFERGTNSVHFGFRSSIAGYRKVCQLQAALRCGRAHDLLRAFRAREALHPPPAAVRLHRLQVYQRLFVALLWQISQLNNYEGTRAFVGVGRNVG